MWKVTRSISRHIWIFHHLHSQGKNIIFEFDIKDKERSSGKSHGYFCCPTNNICVSADLIGRLFLLYFLEWLFGLAVSAERKHHCCRGWFWELLLQQQCLCFFIKDIILLSHVSLWFFFASISLRFCCQSPWCCPSWLCHLILLFLENGDILVVVLVTLNAVENPRGHVLTVELRYLEWWDDYRGSSPRKIATILKSWSHIFVPAKTWCPQAYLGRRRNSSAPLCPCSPAWFRCGRLLWSITAMMMMMMKMSMSRSTVLTCILGHPWVQEHAQWWW